MDKDQARAVSAYLVRVSRAYKRGDATEHTYRPFLQELIEALAKGVTCTNEPKGSKAGHPDLKVSLGETPLGYIETKDIGADLDAIVETSQLRRYLQNIPNLILTDYLEFRWYQNGSEVTRCRLGAFSAKGALRRNPDAPDELCVLIANFTQAEVKTIGSPKELAQRMAALARLTKRHVTELFASEERKGDLHSLLRAFREVLLPDLDEKSFADMYAQTVCYGLFASICNSMFPQQFCRENAADNLPATNPFLRRLFHHIVGPDLHSRVREDIERVVFLLKHADIGSILKDFGKRTRREDPVVHFYETFLAEYDAKLRKTRGVYYTPEPVVSYIVRSVDWLLKEKFGKKDGLADPSVIVLDPACGTGTFLYTVIKLIHERVEKKGQYGAWSSYVRQNLLPRIFGFELLMAPYAVAHLKLGLLLKDTGYDFSGDERLGVYLTNTLEEAAKKSDILFAEYISEEANAATEVKKDKPVMVVLGNPPYSGHSANRSQAPLELGLGDSYWVASDDFQNYPGGIRQKTAKGGRGARKGQRFVRKGLTFIGQLMRSYFCVDGGSLGEKTSKWLQDDYVKFIRWSQWRIERTGAGIHAYISNNGYLDNPTFRGMRQQLLSVFDDLRVLDLHGNTNKGEVTPDGAPDKNVFDIKQGVAIGVFTRDRERTTPVVYHSDLYGSRSKKYAVLAAGTIDSTVWERISPSGPNYLFTPQDDVLKSELSKWRTLAGASIFNHTGVITKRDSLAIGWTPDDVWRKVQSFISKPIEEARAEFGLPPDVRDWRVEWAQADLRRTGLTRDRVIPILYRPFDLRYTYYTGHSRGFLGWPVAELTDHMVQRDNLGLITTRQTRDNWGILAARHTCGHKACAAYDVNSMFPQYLYPPPGREDLFTASQAGVGSGGRRSNLNQTFIKEFSGKLGLEFVPDGGPVTARELGDRGSLKRKIATAASQPRNDRGAKAARNDGGVFGPEDVFNYIYSVFHSPTYRKRYAEFLKIDFPRVPLTSDTKLFRKLCALGGELVALHLMESPLLDTLVTRYPKKGNNAVTKVQFQESVISSKRSASRNLSAQRPPARDSSAAVGMTGRVGEGRVWINDDQYFEGIRPEEWEFHIGGYQVLDKWLKDRKKAKRKLSADDIRHYQRIVVAIRNTIRLMSEIDQAIPKWPIE